MKFKAEPVDSQVASPCTSVCTLDTGSICIGCGRTLDEIARWSAADDAERLHILARVEERRREKAR